MRMRNANPSRFWSVDIPTTQEQEEDRERPRKQVREEVVKRYVKAMRLGCG